MAQTLSTNHPLRTPRQTPDLEAVDRDFTRPFRMLVSDARDRPKGGLPLVSAAPRLVSARLTDNFRQLTRENFPPSRHFTVWTSHAAGCPTFTRQAGGCFSPGICTAAFLTATIHRLVKHPPGRLLSGWIAIWIAPRQGRSSCASRPLLASS